MDRTCCICGTQFEVQSFIWQGQESPLCYECWEGVCGDLPYDDGIPEQREAYDDD